MFTIQEEAERLFQEYLRRNGHVGEEAREVKILSGGLVSDDDAYDNAVYLFLVHDGEMNTPTSTLTVLTRRMFDKDDTEDPNETIVFIAHSFEGFPTPVYELEPGWMSGIKDEPKFYG